MGSSDSPSRVSHLIHLSKPPKSVDSSGSCRPSGSSDSLDSSGSSKSSESYGPSESSGHLTNLGQLARLVHLTRFLSARYVDISKKLVNSTPFFRNNEIYLDRGQETISYCGPYRN